MTLSRERIQDALAGRYRLERELGGGAMATVYLADDLRLGRAVAIKVLRDDAALAAGTERFLREIEIAARLQHPHIVPLLDSGAIAGTPWLAMPYVDGESLRSRLDREGRLAPVSVIRILTDVADALAYAHRKGIVHRDIKPDNILLSGRHALVADFGVAKAMRAASDATPGLTGGLALGTPAYMAPEQATADPALDHRVDLYALGVVAYELLAGAPPFDAPTAQGVLTAHLLDDPPPLAERAPGTPAALVRIVERALAKSPAARWQSGEELLAALEPLTTPSSSQPVARPRPARRWAVLLPYLIVAGAVAILVTRKGQRPPAPGGSLQHQVTFDGHVGSIEVSPDGGALAYVREDGPRTWLMVRDLATGTDRRLASGSPVDLPLWSADGREVRFWSFEQGQYRLATVPLDGGTPRVEMRSGSLTPSPDARLLARSPQGRGYLAVLDSTHRDSVVVPVDRDRWYSRVAWAGSGGLLAYSATRPDSRHSEVLVASGPGWQPVRVAEESTAVSRPSWGPGGRYLYYLRGPGPLADLMRVRIAASGAAGGVPDLVAAGLEVSGVEVTAAFLRSISIGPDGRRAFYTRLQEESNLFLARLDPEGLGEPPRALTTGSAHHWAPRISPDGRSIAYLRTRPDGSSLEVIPLAGGPSREVGRLQGGRELAWAPDGRRIAVVAPDPDGGLGLQVFSLDGRGVQRMFRGQVGDFVAWLGDSLLLADRIGNRPPAVFDPASLEVHPIPGLDTAGWAFSLRPSPDRARLAMARNFGGGRNGLLLQGLVEQGSEILVDDALYPVRWSTDGRELYAVSFPWFPDSTQVFRFVSVKGPPQVLRRFALGWQPEDVTPDGRTAVLTFSQRRSDAWVLDLPPEP